MRKAVYILGTGAGAASTSEWGDRVPWDADAEIWLLNEGSFHRLDRRPRWDRWFEMHWPVYWQDPAYRRWLRLQGRPIYMLRRHDDIPASVAYPLEEAIRFTGRPYFTDTFCYEIALAMMEGFEEIHLYGADLFDYYEYHNERPCVEYLLGRAEGMGIKVHVEPPSTLLREGWLYGYEEPVVLSMLQGKEIRDKRRIVNTIGAGGGITRFKERR